MAHGPYVQHKHRIKVIPQASVWPLLPPPVTDILNQLEPQTQTRSGSDVAMDQGGSPDTWLQHGLRCIRGHGHLFRPTLASGFVRAMDLDIAPQWSPDSDVTKAPAVGIGHPD